MKYFFFWLVLTAEVILQSVSFGHNAVNGQVVQLREWMFAVTTCTDCVQQLRQTDL